MSAPLVLTIPRKLASPNTWQGRHWYVKNRITKAWEDWLWAEMVCNVRPSQRRQCGRDEPRTVTIERHVPRRQFIRDEDNLRFSVKPLLDALKRLGLIYDDSATYLTWDITQHVSETAQTVIRIQ